MSSVNRPGTSQGVVEVTRERRLVFGCSGRARTHTLRWGVDALTPVVCHPGDKPATDRTVMDLYKSTARPTVEAHLGAAGQPAS